MKRIALTAGLAATAAAVVAVISSGSAAAAGTDVTGQKYSDASSALRRFSELTICANGPTPYPPGVSITK